MPNLPEKGVKHIINLSFEGVKSETMMTWLSQNGIYVSNGSTCKKGKTSGTLAAFGLPRGRIESAVRVSFSPENTAKEIDRFFEAAGEFYRLYTGN